MKKRMYLPLLTLALTGALLLTGCSEKKTPPTGQPSDSTETNRSSAQIAAAFYAANDISLPEDFYRPDLIWDTYDDWGASDSLFESVSKTAYYEPGQRAPSPNQIYLCSKFRSDIDADAQYAILIRIYQPESETKLDEYLSAQGWEVLSLPDYHPRVLLSFSNLYAATRSQVEALNASDLAAYCGTMEKGLEIYIAGQSTAPTPPEFNENGKDVYEKNNIVLPENFYRPDLIWGGVFLTYPHIDYIPSSGELLLRDPYPTGMTAADRCAFCFVHYDYTDDGVMKEINEEGMIEYLTGLGWEEVGKDGGYSYPIFAATQAQLEALDCKALQNAMGISTDIGLDVQLADFRNKSAPTYYPDDPLCCQQQ